MFSLESIRFMNAKALRKAAWERRRALLKAERAKETPEAKEARLSAWERDALTALDKDVVDDRETV